MAAAREAHERSLRIARTAGQPYSVARALAGIAGCLGADDPERERLLTEALEMFERMGVPERFEVRERMRIASIGGGRARVERGWSGDD